MPVTRHHQETDPLPPSKFHNSLIYETPEWKSALRELEKGLKPLEYIQIALSEQTVAQLPLKDPVPAFVVALRRYVRRKKLDVDVTTRAATGEEDTLRIYIVGQKFYDLV